MYLGIFAKLFPYSRVILQAETCSQLLSTLQENQLSNKILY